MKTIAFFNNKGGVGKTSLVYHLAWMYQELGVTVIAADLDPQANLTSMFLEEDRLEKVWPDGEHPRSILGSVRPILKGTGDIQPPSVESITENLGLIIGDLGLSGFEDRLSDAWPRCNDGDEAAFRTISALFRIIYAAAQQHGSSLALIDIGPNLGAINRAAMIATQHIIVPLAPDLYSLQGLRNLGPTLRRWRAEWGERLKKNPDKNLMLPKGEMQPEGYVIMQHAVRSDRPVKAYGKWMDRIPGEYRDSVLDKKQLGGNYPPVGDDPYCLALLKHFRSLMPMAMEVRKPMFSLKPADGALGAHLAAVQDCRKDFEALARKIAKHCSVILP